MRDCDKYTRPMFGAIATTIVLAFSWTLAGGEETWRIRIASPQEPGTPLVVSGTILEKNGGRPIAGARVYVYQTDSTGLYSPSGAGPNQEPPRLRGTMKTDSEGRFEFRTIRPAGYPGGRNPEHIHYRISAPGYEALTGEILFDDDSRLNERQRRNASNRNWPVVRAKADSDGVLHCDVKLRLRSR